MPVHVEKRKGGGKPYKIVETATGHVVGSSTSRKKAEISAWHRNRAAMVKQRGGLH